MFVVISSSYFHTATVILYSFFQDVARHIFDKAEYNLAAAARNNNGSIMRFGIKGVNRVSRNLVGINL